MCHRARVLSPGGVECAMSHACGVGFGVACPPMWHAEFTTLSPLDIDFMRSECEIWIIRTFRNNIHLIEFPVGCETYFIDQWE